VSRKPRQLSRYLAEAEKLGRVIREARAEAGMTQIEVAAISGVPYSTLRAIERAHVTEPSFFAVMYICAAIGLKPTELASLLDGRYTRTMVSGRDKIPRQPAVAP
jgi:transcriptional regulator with XRE-family HTH domain